MEKESLFTITDKYELLALHRALFEVQFSVAPYSREVPGSPFVASMANRAVDALTQQDSRWAAWRAASNHPDRVEIIRRRLSEIPDWPKMSQSEREAYVRDHLAPLVPDNELLQSLAGAAQKVASTLPCQRLGP